MDEMYKKPLMLTITGLSSESVFYNVKVRGTWKGYKKSIGEFVYMFAILYPDIMRQVKKQGFIDNYQITTYLYSYGYECGKTYIFYNK